MKSRILELQTLINNGACAEQVKLFREKFGESVFVTEDLCASVAHEFDFDWAAMNLLSPAAWAEYMRVKDSAWTEYMCAASPARREYERAVKSGWAEYRRAAPAAWAEYERGRAPALAEYMRGKASAFARGYLSDDELLRELES
jgi:hypothetical protein